MIKINWTAFFDENVIFGVVSDYSYWNGDDDGKQQWEFRYIWKRLGHKTPWHRCWCWNKPLPMLRND